MTKLKGHRQAQLRLLSRAGAVSRETAVAVAFDRDYRPVTLSAMVGEGLVHNAYLPLNGDSRRRVSHYWLSAAGIAAAAPEVRPGAPGNRAAAEQRAAAARLD